MRTRLISLPILLLLLLSALAHGTPRQPYYLALGDSLAIGVQPTATGDVATNRGYADDLHAAFRTRVPRLGLAKIGCSGETTATMIQGGVCSYAEGSQLAAAVNFLQTHRVEFVTLDIGANDIDHCISLSGIDQTCLTGGLTSIGTNLPQILAELRTAAGPGVPIVAMNYYDAFLAAWKFGSSGQALAQASLQATLAFNALLETTFQAFSIPVANVAGAYRITDFSVVPVINLPLNVFLTLTWTWMGAPAPLGPDVHPDSVGYAVIAGAFAEKIAVP